MPDFVALQVSRSVIHVPSLKHSQTMCYKYVGDLSLLTRCCYSTVLWLPNAPLFLKGWRWHEDAQDLCKTLGCPATHICCWVAHQGISTHCSCAILQATPWHLEGSSEGRKVGGIKWDGMGQLQNHHLITSDLPLMIHSSAAQCPVRRVLFASE